MQKIGVNNTLWIFLVACLLSSCDFFTLQKKRTENEVLAKFNNKALLYKDIALQLPKNLNENDSLLALKSLIDDWALKQILVSKAELNNSLETNTEIEQLVKEYRESLLINRYKEELIQQKLDTVISDEDIKSYYEAFKTNFRLNETILQMRYMTFDKNLLDRKDIVKSFEKGSIEDLEDLESKQLSFKKMMLNDSVWFSINDMLKETVFFRSELLKKSELVQKEDSINLFLAFVREIRQKNEIAPKSYIVENIKAILLHKRKIEVIREIEKLLLKDAIKEKQLIYQ